MVAEHLEIFRLNGFHSIQIHQGQIGIRPYSYITLLRLYAIDPGGIVRGELRESLWGKSSFMIALPQQNG